jgi:hypothetical protein
MTTVTIKAPDWLHRHLLGPKGANIKPIQEAHPDVYIKFHDNDTIDIEGPTAVAPVIAQQLQAKVTDLVRCFRCFLSHTHCRSLLVSRLLKSLATLSSSAILLAVTAPPLARSSRKLAFRSLFDTTIAVLLHLD